MLHRPEREEGLLVPHRGPSRPGLVEGVPVQGRGLEQDEL